jgi:hypothetical protein
VTSLVEKIADIDAALDEAGIAHAFGGALALAWCTGRARGTIDIDLNVFAGVSEADRALAALPAEVTVGETDRAQLARDGQTRLWWDGTPVDVFLNTTPFHEQVQAAVLRRPFAGREMPFLACSDLAVFKAFFNRTKDWADLEDMVAAGSLDVDRTLGVLVRYLGGADERIERLRRLG